MLCYNPAEQRRPLERDGRPAARSRAIPFALVDISVPQLVQIAAIIVIVVISLSLHEAAHGWVALKCGDRTAHDLGRITLNPIPHIDPFMTILVPILLLVSTGGKFVFGGAKPVPVNFHNLRRPYRDMALVALAGPLSNFLIALVLFAVWKLAVFDLQIWSRDNPSAQVLEAGLQLNLALAAFNLIPIPPLDGSRVMTWLLPSGLRESYAGLERFGILLVLLLIWLPATSAFIRTTMEVLYDLARQIVTLGGLW